MGSEQRREVYCVTESCNASNDLESVRVITERGFRWSNGESDGATTTATTANRTGLVFWKTITTDYYDDALALLPSSSSVSSRSAD